MLLGLPEFQHLRGITPANEDHLHGTERKFIEVLLSALALQVSGRELA